MTSMILKNSYLKLASFPPPQNLYRFALEDTTSKKKKVRTAEIMSLHNSPHTPQPPKTPHLISWQKTGKVSEMRRAGQKGNRKGNTRSHYCFICRWNESDNWRNKKNYLKEIFNYWLNWHWIYCWRRFILD